MAVTYTDAVKIDRMDAVIAAIGTTGVIEIGTTGMASILAVIPLANPAAPGAAGAGVITFTPAGMSDTSADNPGTAAEAQIRTAETGSGVDIITGLTVGTAATDIILDSVSITAGQTVTISSATITHA